MDDQATITVAIDATIKASMDAIKEKKGIPIAAQVRFGILQYLETHGENPTAIKPTSAS